MADELGFEISADVDGAIRELNKMSVSLNSLLGDWNNTVRGVGQNNMASIVQEQADKMKAALGDDAIIGNVDKKYLQLQGSLNAATAGFERQAQKVILLKNQLDQLNGKQDVLTGDTEEERAEYDKLTAKIADTQVKLRSAEQATVAYASKVQLAKSSIAEYTQKLQAVAQAQKEADDAAAKQAADDLKASVEEKRKAIDAYNSARKINVSGASTGMDTQSLGDKMKSFAEELGTAAAEQPWTEQHVEMAKLQNQIDSATIAYNKQSEVVNQLQQDYEQLARAKERLSAEGDEQRLGRTTAVLEQTSTALNEAQVKLDGYNAKLQELKLKLEGVKTGSDDAAKGTENLGESAQYSDSFFAQLSRSIRNIAFYRIVRGVIKSIVTATREATQAMAIWSQQFDTGTTGPAASFNDNMSAMASNLLFVRNACMAAVEPLISALAPAFNAVAAAIANALNWLSQFFSAITGRSFYNKAILNNGNYAKSLQSGSKAQKAFLAGFDELERLDDKSGSGVGSSLGIDPSQMWSREEVTDSMMSLTEPVRAALDNIRSIWDSHVEGLKTSASNLKDALGNLFSTVDTTFFDSFFGEGRVGALLLDAALRGLEDTMNNLAVVINNIVAPFATGFIKGFADAAGVIWEFVSTVFSPLVDLFNTFFQFIDAHGETISTLAEKFGYLAGVAAAVVTAFLAVKGIFGVLSSVFALFAANPIVLVIAGVAALIAIFTNLYDTNEDFRNFVNGIIEWAKKLIPGIIQGIQSAWAGFKTFWHNIWNNVIDWFKDIFGIHSPSTVFADFGRNIIQGMINGINNFMSKVRSIPDKILSALDLSDLAASAAGWGADFVDGLVGGINGLVDMARQAASNVAESVKRVLHFSRPDEGPLRDYEKWMPDFMQGLAQGINDNAELVYSSARNLASGIQASMSIPSLGLGGIDGQINSDLGSATQSQINANAALADVFWQGCMAVVEAVNNNQAQITIGDETIGRAANRYNKKQSIINGGVY